MTVFDRIQPLGTVQKCYLSQDKRNRPAECDPWDQESIPGFPGRMYSNILAQLCQNKAGNNYETLDAFHRDGFKCNFLT